MLLAGFHLVFGFACGLRLTMPAFLAVMLAAMAATLIFVLQDAGVLTALGQMALASGCLQAGYLLGVVLRAYAGEARPRFSKSASTPGSLPRKAR
jgi:hypothetical protein